MEAPIRIACCYGHHAEQQGFQIIFTLTDHIGNIIAQTMSGSIMIIQGPGGRVTSASGAGSRPGSSSRERSMLSHASNSLAKRRSKWLPEEQIHRAQVAAGRVEDPVAEESRPESPGEADHCIIVS